jgi:hypothetical protein
VAHQPASFFTNIVSPIGVCEAQESYRIARCLNIGVDGQFPVILQALAPTQPNFWLTYYADEPNPPTCALNSTGFRTVSINAPAAGCVPSYSASGSSYSRCNTTGAYVYTCSDRQCSQDCVITGTSARTLRKNYYFLFFTRLMFLPSIMQLSLALSAIRPKLLVPFATLLHLPHRSRRP